MNTVANPGGSPPPNPFDRPRSWLGGKSIWEGLDLLAKLLVPLILGIATILFGIQQVNLAQQQHQTDQQRTLDQQQAAILQTYMDNMQDLLLNHNLLGSKQNDDIAILAQARTLTALQGLDPERKSRLLIFLYEDELIGFDDIHGKTHAPIIRLNNAKLPSTNLNEAILFGANLSKINLSDVNLSGAELTDVNLSDVKLSSAELTDVNFFQTSLINANLINANLSGADLFRARLVNAHLSGAILYHANLNDADLTGAQNLTQAQLDLVYSCANATLPPGLICHSKP